MTSYTIAFVEGFLLREPTNNQNMGYLDGLFGQTNIIPDVIYDIKSGFNYFVIPCEEDNTYIDGTMEEFDINFNEGDGYNHDEVSMMLYEDKLLELYQKHKILFTVDFTNIKNFMFPEYASLLTISTDPKDNVIDDILENNDFGEHADEVRKILTRAAYGVIKYTYYLE